MRLRGFVTLCAALVVWAAFIAVPQNLREAETDSPRPSGRASLPPHLSEMSLTGRGGEWACRTWRMGGGVLYNKNHGL